MYFFPDPKTSFNMEDALNNPHEPTVAKRKMKKQPTDCRICGAPALYSYFGAVVCGPCKVFFRRNAHKPNQNKAKCHFNSRCEINVNTRNSCAACRLEKCFANGMQTDLIRAPVTGKKKRISTVPTTQSGIVNIIQSDPTILNVEQRNLLSNLTHCYDEHSGFSIAKDYLREQNQLPLKMRFKAASLQNLFTSLINGTRLLFEKNGDFASLCSHDRSFLITKTIEHVMGIGGGFIVRCARLYENHAFSKSMEIAYGSDAFVATNRLINTLDFDVTCIKLILAILTFSTFDYVVYTSKPAERLSDTKLILNVQEKYTELTWRYLLHRFDHQYAVICFSNIVRCLVLANAAIARAAESQNYTNIISSFIEDTEQRLS